MCMALTTVQEQKNSLRSRLTTLVIVAIFGSVTIVTASSVWREIVQYGAGKSAELEASATVFAYAISDHVREGDRTQALEALRAIAQFPDIDYVRVEAASGELFVELGGAVNLQNKSGHTEESTPLSAFTKNSSIVSVPIINAGDVIGVLWVHADKSALTERVATLIWDAMVAAVFAAGIGLLIALRMQRAVTRPIHSLTKVMNNVRTTGDFGNRATRISDDETGELVDSFNEMLDEIQERDAKLLAHQQNLQKIVRHRTRQFEDAKETAEAANLAKSEFLATMSHEIRTPMNGMLVMAELLNSAALAPRQKRYADVIVKSGQSLIAIINDILDFSKIEAGRLELELIPVEPIEVINDVVGLFWERASTSGIDLATYVAPDVPNTIKSDPVRLNQILSNLVNNALKFTEYGSVIVAAKMAVGPAGEKLIEFSVTDTGVGIAREKQRQIFEAFSQADQTTTRKFGGTGLGLAICTKIVEAMDGVINVTSVEGKGSRFFVNFPAQMIAPPRKAPRVRKETRAIIAIEGSATPKNLARYLHEAGISAQIVEIGSVIASHMAYADIIFASPEFLDSFNQSVQGNPDQWVPARICVSELGDDAPDRLLNCGIAEDLIIKPLSRNDVMDQICRVLQGQLRGQNAVKDAAPERINLPSFAGRKVLAADDSAVNREVVSAALTRFQIASTIVSDGRAAVEAVKTNSFDLILMDCSMPGMDGFEATRAIRAWESENNLSRLPIIALTAHVADGDVEWRAAGMDDYVTKPFTILSLADAIGAQLDPSGVIQAAAQLDQTSIEENVGVDEASSKDNAFKATVLKELAGLSGDNGSDLVTRALTLFEEHSKEGILRIAAGIESNDPQEIKSAAHALKSMSFNVGALALGDACNDIENACHNTESHHDLMNELRKHFIRTHEELPDVKARYAKSAA